MTLDELKQFVKQVDPAHPNKYVRPEIKKVYLCVRNREVSFCSECIRVDEGCKTLNEALQIEASRAKKR